MPRSTGRRLARNKPEQKKQQLKTLKRMRLALSIVAGIMFLGVVYFAQQVYQSYVAPDVVYGQWLELDAPVYQREQLTFNAQGVFRDNRLIATHFDFDGQLITVKTGAGSMIYRLTGTHNVPQLHRVEPSKPRKRFVKKEHEHLIRTSSNQAFERRQALSEHFQPE